MTETRTYEIPKIAIDYGNGDVDEGPDLRGILCTWGQIEDHNETMLLAITGEPAELDKIPEEYRR